MALTSCRRSRGQNPGPPPSLRILSRWPELTRTTPQGTPRLERGLRTPQTSSFRLARAAACGAAAQPSRVSGGLLRPLAVHAHTCVHTHARTHTRPDPGGPQRWPLPLFRSRGLGGTRRDALDSWRPPGPACVLGRGGRSEGPRGAVSSSRPCCGQSRRDEIKEPPGLGIRWPGWGRWVACGALGC